MAKRKTFKTAAQRGWEIDQAAPMEKRSEPMHRDAGTFRGIKIVDPPVKPRGVTVKEIRDAVELARGKNR
jgi:hypothetical protein